MSEDPNRPGHEPSDASARTVGALAASIMLLVVLGIGAGIETVRHESQGTPLAAPSSPFAKGADYRPDVERSWEQCEKESAAHLGGYAWIDRQSGRVRIPLERAMDLVAGDEKGAGK
jgi:hypothetical protein